MPDDFSRPLSPGECDQLLRDIARRADAVLRAAHDLALDHADAMLDACGIRRSLSGFNTLCRALALYLDVDVRSVCRRSYKSVVRSLARETRASEAWTNHQMFYALRDAQKSGRFAAFADILRDRLGSPCTSSLRKRHLHGTFSAPVHEIRRIPDQNAPASVRDRVRPVVVSPGDAEIGGENYKRSVALPEEEGK